MAPNGRAIGHFSGSQRHSRPKLNRGGREVVRGPEVMERLTRCGLTMSPILDGVMRLLQNQVDRSRRPEKISL